MTVTRVVRGLRMFKVAPPPRPSLGMHLPTHTM